MMVETDEVKIGHGKYNSSVSDQDSDKSDGEYPFNANHIGWKLLSAGSDLGRLSRI